MDSFVASLLVVVFFLYSTTFRINGTRTCADFKFAVVSWYVVHVCFKAKFLVQNCESIE